MDDDMYDDVCCLPRKKRKNFNFFFCFCVHDSSGRLQKLDCIHGDTQNMSLNVANDQAAI